MFQPEKDPGSKELQPSLQMVHKSDKTSAVKGEVNLSANTSLRTIQKQLISRSYGHSLKQEGPAPFCFLGVKPAKYCNFLYFERP